jgi:hypothetical protein
VASRLAIKLVNYHKLSTPMHRTLFCVGFRNDMTDDLPALICLLFDRFVFVYKMVALYLISIFTFPALIFYYSDPETALFISFYLFYRLDCYLLVITSNLLINKYLKNGFYSYHRIFLELYQSTCVIKEKSKSIPIYLKH